MASSRKSPHTDIDPSEVDVAVIDCIGRHVTAGQQLVVCLSGGVDSVVLLHALSRLRSRSSVPFELSAVHVNHGLSANAGAWEAFCQKVCKELNVALQCRSVIVEKGTRYGLEAAARKARYTVFESIAADWLLLGHHQDDQAETLLFNLLRGTGAVGAGAMRENNGRLLRPLLGIGRDEILTYAWAHQMTWVEDESNQDVCYSRNFLRVRVFSALVERFPAAKQNIAKAARHFAEAKDLLDDLARLDLGDMDMRFPIPIDLLERLQDKRRRNVLRYLLSKHGVMIPSEARLREALRQILDAAEHRQPSVVFGCYRLERRGSMVYLEPV